MELISQTLSNPEKYLSYMLIISCIVYKTNFSVRQEWMGVDLSCL